MYMYVIETSLQVGHKFKNGQTDHKGKQRTGAYGTASTDDWTNITDIITNDGLIAIKQIANLVGISSAYASQGFPITLLRVKLEQLKHVFFI